MEAWRPSRRTKRKVKEKEKEKRDTFFFFAAFAVSVVFRLLPLRTRKKNAYKLLLLLGTNPSLAHLGAGHSKAQPSPLYDLA